MATLKMKEIEKMEKKERQKKLSELRLELIKANVSANKAGAKTKEIKKAIARIITLNAREKNDRGLKKE